MARLPKPPPEQVAPHDLEAEESLLGACLLSREAIVAGLSAGLEQDDFYKPAHGLIWTAIVATHAAGEHADPIVIAARVNRAGIDSQTLMRIQAATPASANAPAYARIVREVSKRRRVMALATTVLESARAGEDIADAVAHLTVSSTLIDPRQRTAQGGTFTLDVPDQIPTVWGADDRILWARGEELLVVGPPGVGKTTVAVQLVAGRIGLLDQVIDLPIEAATRVLYMACDRPSQIQRAFRRLFGHEQHRDLLDERLVIWKGPPPRDFGKHPETLTALAKDHGADCVFIDSLKDVAIGISDDEIGAGLNSAIQQALADGIDVCALHHQRKGQAGAKPRTLEDVYGSVWVTAGAGSVILLWGNAGDPLVELVHLKQPAQDVGPIQIDHDHNTGMSTVSRGDVDPLRVLRNAAHGMTSVDLAMLQTGKEKPTPVEIRKAKRTLERLVEKHLAHCVDSHKGGQGGTIPDRYYATTQDEEQPAPNPKDYSEADRDEEPF